MSRSRCCSSPTRRSTSRWRSTSGQPRSVRSRLRVTWRWNGWQYDPAIIPNLCQVIESGEADIVLGSRWLGLDPAKAGMPWWKRLGNRFLTTSENQVLGLHLSEYHTGYRAYSRRFLEAIPFLENSNDFVFDTQVLIQAATFGFKIGEVPAIGRYHADASSVSFMTSTVYGLKTLGALMQYVLHRAGIPCVWLTPVSDADKESLAISQVAHHSPG